MVIFFDGECNLCNGFIDWLMRLDKKKHRFQFASIQGQTAQQFGIKLSGEKASVVVQEKNDLFYASDAIIKIGRALGGIHAFGANIFALIPKSIREFFYYLVARHRYRLFGKRSTCRLPTPKKKPTFFLKYGVPFLVYSVSIDTL